MPVKTKKREYRNETIQTWEAKEHFDQYYKDNTNSLIGEFRGKIFDMLYQKSSLPRKKGKRRRKDGIDVEYTFNPTIKCNNTKKNKNIKNSSGEKETLRPGHCEKGSIKYLLPKGPKTFDIVGIDSFPEGTKFKVPGDSKNKLYTSKGHSLIKQIDKITKVVAASTKLNKKSDKIYGPRDSKDGELYSSKFRKAYKKRIKRFKKQGGLMDDTTSQLLHLVGFRWKKTAKKKKSPGKKRKIKRKPVRSKAPILIHTGFANTEDMVELEEKSISLDRRYTMMRQTNGSFTIKHNKTPIEESSVEYENLDDFIKVLKLKVRGKVIDNISDIKFIQIKLEKTDEDDDEGADEEAEYVFILNVKSGNLLDTKTTKKLYKNLKEFYKSKETDYEITESKPIDI